MPIKIARYGWRPSPPDIRDRIWKMAAPIVNHLPPGVDLRQGMPPVWDQGNLGSCTANSTAAQCWFLDKTVPYEPSRLFIYYNTRILEGTVNHDSGASIRNAIKAVAKRGFCKETTWPYITSKFKKKPGPGAYKEAKSELIKEYSSVPQTVKHIKSALALGFPVNFGFSVYESFESDAVRTTGKLPMPGKKESMLGGHAVLIVGYDDATECYIVRNSWGSNWGDKGYFYMPYAYVHNSGFSSDFWIIQAVP